MRTAIYLSTTLLTTFLHSLCCLLPLLTAIVGFGGVTSLGWLMQYQAYLLVFQVGLLGWSFYRVYVEHGYASAAHLQREKTLLWGILLVSVVAAVLPHSTLIKTEKQQLTAEHIQRVMNTRKLLLEIKETPVEEQKLIEEITSIDGVVSSQVAVKEGLVSLRYSLKETNKEAILLALRQKGYEVYEKDSTLARK